MTPKSRHLIGCPECDALQRVPALHPGSAALCMRCGAELFRCQPASLDRTLALLLATALLFLVMNSQPLMELEASGIRTATTIFGTARALHEFGMDSVALLVFVTTIVVPAVQIVAILALLVPLRFGVVPPWLGAAFRVEYAVRPWVMVDVFLLGALISLVKLTQIATVYNGPGLYALGFYMLARAAAMQAFEPHEVWHRVDALEAAARPAAGEARA